MALAVCLLFERPAEATLRRLWARLEAAGIATLATHTHGQHVPHLTYASLRTYDLVAVREALESLPDSGPTVLHLDAFGTFRRSRCWLAPGVAAELLARQAAVVRAVCATGAELHRHYEPGRWIPHVTLAPRLRLGDLPTVASVVYDVLPIAARATHAALVDTSTGTRHPLRRVP